MREGDVLVVTNIDRLARSVSHLGDIIRGVRKKKAHLQILNLGIDTTTATGELVLNLLGSVAQFERAMMLERQKEGISKAKAEGKYKGRTPTAMKQADKIVQLFNEGIGPSAISKQLNIGRSSVYRALSSQTAI
jgi:DNA invertase Pin-like site-specific DNA recombinase